MWIAALLGRIPAWIAWTAVGAAVSTVAFLVIDYDRRGTKIATLEHQLNTKLNEVKTLEVNGRLALDAIKQLDARLTSQYQELDESCKALDEVNKVGAAGNAPVGPATSKALEFLAPKRKAK